MVVCSQNQRAFCQQMKAAVAPAHSEKHPIPSGIQCIGGNAHQPPGDGEVPEAHGTGAEVQLLMIFGEKDAF